MGCSIARSLPERLEFFSKPLFEVEEERISNEDVIARFALCAGKQNCLLIVYLSNGMAKSGRRVLAEELNFL